MKRIFALLICTNPAWADCPVPDATFLSCRIGENGKILEVCVDGGEVTYSFGPPGAPELQLSETASEIVYRPWPGIGRTIYEEVEFRNDGYLYTVSAGVVREFDDTNEEVIPHPFGGVIVSRGTEEIAQLTCDETEVEFLWTMALSDAKNAAGLWWDHYEHDWLPKPPD